MTSELKTNYFNLGNIKIQNKKRFKIKTCFIFNRVLDLHLKEIINQDSLSMPEIL